MGRIKEVISKSLTLDSSVRPYILLSVILALALIPINFLENSLPQLSICKLIFGDYCFSVGITRGVSSLLKFNFEQALNYNPISILVLIVMIGIIIFDLSKKLRK